MVIVPSSTFGKQDTCTHQAPTGILTGPLEDISKRLIHPAVVLMNLEVTFRTLPARSSSDLRFLKDIILHVLFIATILEHLCQ